MAKNIFASLLALIALSSCVSTKKYKASLARYDSLQRSYFLVEDQLRTCLSEKDANKKRLAQLEEENANLRATSNVLTSQLADLSVITKQQAESINQSLQQLGIKDAFIKGLQAQMAKKDSLLLALTTNLKGALKDVKDEDIEVKVEGSAVMISISDKMLFRSGSYQITSSAREVLEKIAAVVNGQPNLKFMIEGHTDNKPIRTDCLRDNWDLSVMRATSIARVLQEQYKVDPARMIPCGRSEYVPIAGNDTPEGRQKNRRIKIIMLPQLDEFFKLMEQK
ncbi:MAG: flagellar motor protein MotB [Chitinophagales bacterium]|nr:flagellar motor protein MotB [Chitinophagales bacterium]MDW8392715.1 flagellar motor protein MotB [Chitinophagales bacterium]